MFLKDLFFPKYCLHCRKLGSYICNTCEKSLKVVETDRCLYCRRASHLGFTHPSCLKRYGVDSAIGVYEYSAVMRSIIKNIKYRLVREAMQDLESTMQLKKMTKFLSIKGIYREILLQPIPLHKIRLNKRGFNQAELIASYFSKALSSKTIQVLVRKIDTIPQANLEHEKRYENMKGAFELVDSDPIHNRNIVLIDDVITTGHTIREAARVLKLGGAASVSAFSLARV